MEGAVERLWATYATSWLRVMSRAFLRCAWRRKTLGLRESVVRQKKVDRLLLRAYAFGEIALNPALQATPHLYTIRELWEQFRERWCTFKFQRLFRFLRDDVDIWLPLFDIQASATHVRHNKSVFAPKE
jgi:hypothetical protein